MYTYGWIDTHRLFLYSHTQTHTHTHAHTHTHTHKTGHREEKTFSVSEEWDAQYGGLSKQIN